MNVPEGKTKETLLDPAIEGTKGILRAIKEKAPSVKRVVITSSFAAIVDPKKQPLNHKYSEVSARITSYIQRLTTPQEDWNPVTMEEAENDPSTGYRASKTFAEKAGWDFIKNEKPNFTLSTVRSLPLLSSRSTNR